MKRITNHPIIPEQKERTLVSFQFEGKQLQGYEDEMVSSALFANDIKEFSVHRKGDAPQGIFCASGQCAQCTVIIDGVPLKSCVTPLKEGMVIKKMIHVPELPKDDSPLHNYETKIFNCDVLIVGAGPSGLTASIELAKLGFRVILVDDKDRLGGKLVLQTHKFFGSEEDCYASTRGTDIATILENEVRSYPSIEIFTESAVVGIYKDQKAGLFVENKHYVIVEFKSIIVATG
ncbi:(2Fe-2S)-binding protein, partial [bacterium]|nr:(2Fe-2S)-binding protein [bacterium]